MRNPYGSLTTGSSVRALEDDPLFQVCISLPPVSALFGPVLSSFTPDSVSLEEMVTAVEAVTGA